MGSSLLLAAMVSAFSIVLLIYAKRHKAGIPVPTWTIRYGAALAFVGFAAVSLFSSYLRIIDPNGVAEQTLNTPFFWLVLFSGLPATGLSMFALNIWVKRTMPPCCWLTPLLNVAMVALIAGGFTLAHRAINECFDAIERYSQYGHEFSDAGRYAEAIPEYQKILALDPISPNAHLQLGIALYVCGRDAEAAPHLNATIENEPKYYFGGHSHRASAINYLDFIRQRAGSPTP